MNSLAVSLRRVQRFEVGTEGYGPALAVTG